MQADYSGWRAARFWATGLGLAVAALVGCSNDQTELRITVNVEDYSVPFVSELDFSVTSTLDPATIVSAKLVSTSPTTLDGGLPPIAFPTELDLQVNPSYLSGPVVVEVDGVDNASGVVLARGTADAQVVSGQQRSVTVTLHGLECLGPDGGPLDGSTTPCDGGARDVDGGPDGPPG